jgi:alpha-L-fucosidase 2
MNPKLLLIVASASALMGTSLAAAVASAPSRRSALTLWSRQEARRWTEALSIGNGRLGGMVLGGVREERISLNEDTFWSGEPYDNLNPKGLTSLPGIRRLLVKGRHEQAQDLIECDMNGRYNRSHLPLGDLKLEFPPPRRGLGNGPP